MGSPHRPGPHTEVGDPGEWERRRVRSGEIAPAERASRTTRAEAVKWRPGSSKRVPLSLDPKVPGDPKSLRQNRHLPPTKAGAGRPGLQSSDSREFRLIPLFFL